MAETALVSDALQPTLGARTMGALSAGTGSVLIDAGIGAAAGAFIAPSSNERGAYAIGGAVATGVGGVFGLALVAAFAFFNR